ncbi:glycosyltransferase family 2 protein [Thermus sp. NMX2.A1]|uniref:glycosyltransferase n=1 Tax=Thermus sp. NMX2.A1 TaxID=570924 RepID=UPI0003DDB73D|nr:glycosyltransferase [Thermus sp. NMX2.A1]ETN89371.1 family 2 glycosyl transferase [Thermus sp. NMX2.A1]
MDLPLTFDFFFGVLLFLLLRWLALLYNLLSFPRLKPLPTPQGASVSLLVPARNEAENLRQNLPRLLRQGALEVLVLDDLSEDETARVAEEVGGKNHPSFRLIPGKPLPKNWKGKNWACWQLAKEAKGEILVFTDADVAWEDGALGGILAGLRKWPFLSALPRQEVANPLTAAVVPFVMGGLFSFLPHPYLQRLRVANGQVLAIRRDLYFALGGHEAVKGEILEDVALARKAPTYRLVLGTALFRARMYPTYREAVEGFGKNFLDIHLKNPAILLGSAFYHLALYTLPWLFGRLDLGLLGLGERLLVQVALGEAWWPSLFTPLAPVLLLPIYLRALLPGKKWKGRPTM